MSAACPRPVNAALCQAEKKREYFGACRRFPIRWVDGAVVGLKSYDAEKHVGAGLRPAPTGASVLVQERHGAVDDVAEDAEAEHEVLAILFLLDLLLAQAIGLRLRRDGLVLRRRVAVGGLGIGGLGIRGLAGRGLVRLGFGLSLRRRGRLA